MFFKWRGSKVVCRKLRVERAEDLVDEVPNEEDWLSVGNDLIVVMNDMNKIVGLPMISPHKQLQGFPGEDVLDAYEKIVPGAKNQLIEMARANMRDRLSRSNH